MRSCIIKRDEKGNVKVYNSLLMKKAEQEKLNFQIIGEKGAANIQEYKKLLDKAKDMLSKGVRQSLISLETGWYKSQDGWKYLSEETIKDFKIKKYEENKILNLKEVLGNENKIFKIYPQMAETKVVFINNDKQLPLGIEELPKDVNGNFMEDTNTIRISTKERGVGRTPKEIQNTLGHEVSHVTQLIEGFVNGGNYNSVLDEALKILNIEKEDRYLNDIRQDIQNADKSDLTENEKKIVDDSLYTIMALELNNIDYLHSQYSHIMGEIDANIVQDLVNKGVAEGTYQDLLSMYLTKNNIKPENIYFLRNGNIRFQIIGEKGAANLKDAVVVLENLKVAKQMQQAGKNAKTIKLATGWEQSGKTDTSTSLTTEQKINFLIKKGDLEIGEC